MISRRAISFALLGVILWNAVLSGAGVLMICSHDEGQAHLVSQSDDCHEPCGDSEKAKDCEDLTLTGVDLLTSRQDELKLQFLPLALPPVFEMNAPSVDAFQYASAPLRGPPIAQPRIHISVPTTVLLI